MLIRLKSQQPFGIAGLWEEWKNPQEISATPLRTFAIITCDVNAALSSIHCRMPCILRHEEEDIWLDMATPTNELIHCLRPFSDEEMEIFQVSKQVNNARNNDSSLIIKSFAV